VNVVIPPTNFCVYATGVATDLVLGEKRKRLFIGGGITGCWDWQAKLLSLIEDCDGWAFNPRRQFPPDDMVGQITWEWRALNLCHAISFWFSQETIQPIALLELGRWSAKTEPHSYLTTDGEVRLRMETKKLFVGVDPQYARRQDIEVQLKLQCPDLRVVYNLEELAEQIKKWA
jgi:hypothetical protein